MSPELLCRYGYEIVQPVRFTLYLRVARPKRSVGVSRSTGDSHALRTSGRATHRQKLTSIVQVETFCSTHITGPTNNAIGQLRRHIPIGMVGVFDHANRMLGVNLRAIGKSLLQD